AHTVQEACQLLGRRGPGRWVWLPALLGQLALVGWLLSGPRPVAEAPRTAASPQSVLVPRLAPAPMPVAPEPPAPPEQSAPAAAPATSEPPPTPAAPAAAPATVAPSVRPAAVRPPAPAAAQTTTPRPRWHGHGVNVGLYSDASNAQRAVALLRQAGLPLQT